MVKRSRPRRQASFKSPRTPNHDRDSTRAIPDTTNARYELALEVRDNIELPGAGKGLWINGTIKKGDVVGIYENATTGARRTRSRITDTSYISDYSISFNGLYRDALDTTTGAPCCKLAHANDALDPTKDNLFPAIHKTRPHVLLIIASRDIQDEWGYLPYGGYFWCDDKYDLPLLISAIKRYSIDIFSSTDTTDGDWGSLKIFPTLSVMFPQDGLSLIFNIATKDWRPFDTICESRDCIHHYNDASGRERSSFTTQELQDLRAGQLGTTVLGAYFKVLCSHSSEHTVRYFDPL